MSLLDKFKQLPADKKPAAIVGIVLLCVLVFMAINGMVGQYQLSNGGVYVIARISEFNKTKSGKAYTQSLSTINGNTWFVSSRPMVFPTILEAAPGRSGIDLANSSWIR